MFTVEQIEEAHSKVKSGTEFPNYIREIKKLGVIAFETWVRDSHTEYFGENEFKTVSKPSYANLEIKAVCDPLKFRDYLKMHQKGETDYFTFCKHCAETGVEKWTVSLHSRTCTYYDMADNEILTEKIPE